MNLNIPAAKSKFAQLAVLTISALCVGLTLPASSKKAAAPEVDGQKDFKQYCAQCHAAGGNNVNPSKPISGSQKLATLATFKAYLEAPLGHMPVYPHIIKDKVVLQALFKYCKSLSKEPRKQA